MKVAIGMELGMLKWFWRHVWTILLSAGSLGVVSGLGAWLWTRSLQAGLRYLWLVPTSLIAGAIVLAAAAIIVDAFDILVFVGDMFSNWDPKRARK